MVYVPITGNAQAASIAVIGADVNDTVTPANPTPPTNIKAAGFTPPSTKAIAAPADPEDWEDPLLFADASGDSAIGGMPPEGAGHEGYDSTINASYNDLLEYSIDPNNAHPSSPGYVPPGTTMGMSETQVAGAGGRDSIEYADEDFEEDEEDAAEAAREASGTRPRGRPTGSKNKRRKHK